MERTVKRADNFGAGPAALPLAVLERAQAELLDFRGTGMSVMELSHRSQVYEQVHDEAKQRLKALLEIPDGYDILFLQGGASLQFAMLPMNFLTGPDGSTRTGAYVLTGSWAEKAYQEAAAMGSARVAASSENDGYRKIPRLEDIQWQADDAYLHITSNNTIYGSQWQTFPDQPATPLVADMSSDLLSRPLPISSFHMIYGGAQKNLGPSGVTVVIVKSSWVAQANPRVPTMLRYGVHAKNNSLYNTPPTFGIYLLGLTAQWVADLGGLTAIERVNQEKAALVYGAIDNSDGYYRGYVDPAARSRMNVTFNLVTPDLEKRFLNEATAAGFVGLAGHRSVGGCRVSLYNAVSVESCARLADFMDSFRKTQG